MRRALPSVGFDHRSFILGVVFLAAACGGGSGSEPPTADVPRSVVVRWRPTADAVGYVVHWGSVSGAYDEAVDVGAPPVEADGTSRVAIEYARVAGTIYVALTSYDADFGMSAFSNELAAAVP
jgi:hypothetical protein